MKTNPIRIPILKWLFIIFKVCIILVLAFYSIGMLTLGLWLRIFGDIEVSLLGWTVIASFGYDAFRVILLCWFYTILSSPIKKEIYLEIKRR